MQMPGSDQAISSVVAWASDHQHLGVGGWRVLGLDCACAAEPCQFHQLVYSEAQRAHELLIDFCSLLCTPAKFTLQTVMLLSCQDLCVS